VKIKFGRIHSNDENATVNVTVWNARGPQNAPGSVIETRKVLLKQIQEDIANDRYTEVVFERETPVFSRPFHVGVELTYHTGDSVAIISSANGEATTATSWVKLTTGEWKPFTIAYGANIAMDISPIVGINPSVQVAASRQLVTPGQQVILNARGASVFIWNADDGTIQDVPGPQIIVNPLQTTTYTISGSGLELCNSAASITIYAEGEITGVEEKEEKRIRIYPNPGAGVLNIQLENSSDDEASVQIFSSVGSRIGNNIALQKSGQNFTATLDTHQLPPGLYILQIKAGDKRIIRKWLKQK
jgi:hypothetical protein